MTLVTFRVIDGADRGHEFADVPTPDDGREEGNPIQLNDERVSRYHLKIQDDQNKVVLADLESTNGTKVNGESVQLWICGPATLFRSAGACWCTARARKSPSVWLLSAGRYRPGRDHAHRRPGRRRQFLFAGLRTEPGDDPDALALLHTLMPPELPVSLSPGQIAQLAEVLQYIHMRIRGLIDSVQAKDKSDRVTLDARQWQNLIDLQTRLANYLCAIGEPF